MNKQKLREEIYKNSEKFTGHVEGTESQSKQEADRHKEWLKKSDQLFNLITEYTAQAVAEAREEAVDGFTNKLIDECKWYERYQRGRIVNWILGVKSQYLSTKEEKEAREDG